MGTPAVWGYDALGCYICWFGISEFWGFFATFMTNANLSVMCQSGWDGLGYSYTTEISSGLKEQTCVCHSCSLSRSGL